MSREADGEREECRDTCAFPDWDMEEREEGKKNVYEEKRRKGEDRRGHPILTCMQEQTSRHACKSRPAVMQEQTSRHASTARPPSPQSLRVMVECIETMRDCRGQAEE
jgi:hypothetical protein